ncbi:zf-TFIIB domain-containing protein [Archangium lansingense]|uniref:TFIIB-type zinc ribbon-containing protein n=1 Tax=Archangium lansingense TaxID=2995310 RepID=UPI003B779F07
MKKPDSKCPGCTQVLQPFLVPTPSGTELELHRCTHCGGFWGAGGCIQDTFGPSARHQLIGGLTERNCVECRILMTPALLPSDISVEVCSACRGMFLDAGELARLGVRENQRAPAQSGLPKPADAPRRVAPPPVRASPPPPPPLPKSPPSKRVAAEDPEPREAPAPSEEPESFSLEVAPPVETAGTFKCIECGKRKPLREGQALRDGLACRACMKARVEGSDNEDFSLGNLFRGRPKS